MVFQAYWSIKVVNIVVVYEEFDQINALTYNPYHPKEWTINLTTTKYRQDLFQDKTKNLYGSKIRALLTYKDRTKVKEISQGVYEGKDYQLVSTLVESINGKLEIEEMDYWDNPWQESLYYENRTNRKIKALKQREISLMIKSESFNVDDDVIDNLYPHTQNDLSCLFRKSAEVTAMKKFMMIMSTKEWIVVQAIPCILFFGPLLCARRRIAGSLNLKTFKLICEALFTLKFPLHPLDRIFLIGWTFLSFVVFSYWQSKTTCLFTIKTFEPEYDTLDAVFQTGIPLFALSVNAEEFRNKYKGTKYETYGNSVVPLTTHEGFIDAILAEDYSTRIDNPMVYFLIEHDFAVYICRRFRIHDLPIYHLVRESVIPKLQSYKMAHGSPLYHIFNKNLRRLIEAGFVELWSKTTIFNATIQRFIYPSEYGELKHIEPLTLDATEFALYILIVGQSLATCVFTLEIIFQKLL